MRAFVAATSLLCASPSFAQTFPPGLRGSRAAARGRSARDRRSRAALRHLLGHRLRRRGRPDVRERRQHRLAAHRLARELHAHDQLGRRHERRDLRPQAGAEPRVVEVRPRLAGRHADAEARRVRRTSSTARYAWHIDGDGAAGRRAARAGGALSARSVAESARASSRRRACRARIPIAFWRWEQLEKGRDGNVVAPEKVHVVAITMLGKYRVDATINSQNSDHAHQDHGRTSRRSATSTSSTSRRTQIDVRQREVADRLALASRLGRQLAVLSPEHRPQRLRRRVPERAAERLRRRRSRCRRRSRRRRSRPHGDGRRRWPTASTCSAAARPTATWSSSSDFVAVFEAPGNEQRSLAVIEEIAKLAPDKPIRWLVSSHPHFDHIGGLRTYLHIGATIVAHTKNIPFLNRDVLNYEPRTVAPDIVVALAADRGGRGLQLRSRAGELRHHRQRADPARLLRAAAAARRRHADGLSAGRADRVPGRPLRHARAAAGRRSCRRCAASRLKSSA